VKRVVASAPGRVNLIGEHIDYNDGWVLPFAIQERTRVTISRREDSKIAMTSSQKKGSVEIDFSHLAPSKRRSDWSDYIAGTIWALQIDHGVDIHIDGQVPLGAGLSSSAALECAVALGLDHLFSLGNSREDLARLAQRAENEYVGMPCGIMDQSVSLLAKAGHALLIDCVTLESRDIPFDLASQGLELLIIDTNVHHALVDGGYRERRERCERALRQLGIRSMRELDEAQLELFGNSLDEISYKRVRHAVTEIARVHQSVALLERGDFIEIGKVLSASHLSLKNDYEVSCGELDLAVEVAESAGALGARMVGGGFGGSAIALTPSEKVAHVKSEITQAFLRANFAKPRFFTALPSDGARLESVE
jgi:galactokinase